eukprot:10477391-Lingulodinium_polyedra.AAC.1
MSLACCFQYIGCIWGTSIGQLPGKCDRFGGCILGACCILGNRPVYVGGVGVCFLVRPAVERRGILDKKL